MPLYLGLDARSDKLTALVIDIGDERKVVFDRSINFDSPAMWDDALDQIIGELATHAELDFDDLRGISGAVDAHEPAAAHPAEALLALQPSKPLAPQLRAIASAEELEAMRAAGGSFFTELLGSSYWQKRYSLPRVRIVPWETTHASTLIGTGIIRPGLLLVALGTNDMMADLNGELAFRNGALARDWIRLEHRLDWDEFASLLEERPGNDGCLMLPWLEPEVTPPVAHAGLRRFGFDRLDAGRNVRGLVEGQMMAMANHVANLDPARRSLDEGGSLGEGGTAIDRIIVTGVDATNRALLQVMSNVFGVDVYRLDVANAAALGAALRAYQADRLDSVEPVSWSTVVSGFTEPNPGHRVSPNPKLVAMYAELRREYAALESRHKDRAPTA